MTVSEELEREEPVSNLSMKGTQAPSAGSVAWVVAVSLLSGCSMLRSSTERRLDEARAAEELRLATIRSSSPVWVSIPDGTFQMGSTSFDSDERPVHSVALDAFEMSATEVTVAQYRLCVDAGECNVPDSCDHGEPNFTMSDREYHPINCVSWSDASTFAAWAGGRLPTEAEWEYAARGGQSFTFAGSNTATDVGWISSNSGSRTHEVSGLSANGYGLYDMTGNVWEWVSDWYASDYYSSSPSSNPEGPASASGRVARGGSLYFNASSARIAFRDGGPPSSRNDSLGFRLAR
jgi:formylglycine-generating enzyme required for sulfatase activity